MVLTIIALGLAASIEIMPVAARWLSDQLKRGLTEGPAAIGSDVALGSAVGLSILLGALCVLVIVTLPRRRARASFSAVPTQPAPAWVSLGLTAIAITLIAAASMGVIAGAARSVDATIATLALVWSTWIRRGLLALAGSAAVVAVVEQRVEARRIWLALHQTPAQVRAESRARARS